VFSSGQLLVGTACVVFATYLYSVSPRHPRTLHRPAPIHVAMLEKTTIDRLGTPRPDSASAGVARVTSAGQDIGNSPSRGMLDPMDAARGMGLSTSRPASPMYPRASPRKDWDE
jgi:UDP-sugar transporter A1/2/3